MPKRTSFLDMLDDNPHGWGNLPPMPQDDPYALPRYQPDEYGALKDSHGRFPESVDSTPSLSDSLYNIAVSPAQMLVGGVTEPLNALSRLGHSGTQSPLGVPDYNDANKHDMSTLTMAMFGGQAFNPLRAGEGVAARALSDTGKPSVLGAALAGAESKPIRGVHYTTADFDKFDPTIAPGSRGSSYGVGVYSVPLDEVKRMAETGSNQSYSYGSRVAPGARSIPIDTNLAKPFHVETDPTYAPTDWAALRKNWLGPKWRHDAGPGLATESGLFDDYASAAGSFNDALKAHGHDGVIVSNRGKPVEVVATEPNTVRSATTGETLFSDTGKPSLVGSALPMAGIDRNLIDYIKSSRGLLRQSADGADGSLLDTIQNHGVSSSHLEKAIEDHKAQAESVLSNYNDKFSSHGYRADDINDVLQEKYNSASDAHPDFGLHTTELPQPNIPDMKALFERSPHHTAFENVRDADSIIGSNLTNLDRASETLPPPELNSLGGHFANIDQHPANAQHLRGVARNLEDRTGPLGEFSQGVDRYVDRRMTALDGIRDKLRDRLSEHDIDALFSDTGKPSALGAALAGDHGQDQNAALMDILKQYGVKLD